MRAARRSQVRTPFKGLRPAPDTEHARWVAEEVGDPFLGRVGVPTGFEGYLRILHPRPDGRSWAQADPAALLPDGDPLDIFARVNDAVSGSLDPAVVDALLPALKGATTTPDDCHYGLWVGWGWFGSASGAIYGWDRRWPSWLRRRTERRLEREHRQRMEPIEVFVESCAVIPRTGGHDVWLFDGPVRAVASIGTPWRHDGSLRRESPQWWWPEDRAWFLSTGIDDLWTHIGGPRKLLDAVLSDDRIEAVEVPEDSRW